MSNYWRLRCLTCSSDSTTTWNHGDEAVKMVAKQRKLICDALAILEGFDVELDIKVAYQYLDQGWLREHKDHDVRAADEYGKVFTIEGEFDPIASTPRAVEWERKQGRPI